MMFLFTFIFYTHSYALFIYLSNLSQQQEQQQKCYQIVSGREGKNKKKLRYTPFLLKLEEKCRKPSFNLLLLADQPSTFGTSIKKKACKHTNSATTCSFSPVENNLYIYFTRTFILFTRS